MPARGMLRNLRMEGDCPIVMTAISLHCPHFSEGTCKIASDLAGEIVRPHPSACSACLKDANPQSLNRVTVSIAISNAGPRARRRLLKKHRAMLTERTGQDSQSVKTSMAGAIVRYANARRRWIKAGRPVRSDERVAELLAICQACEYGGKGGKRPVKRCGICGCRINKGHFLNKLRWATERCPKNPPNWANDR